MEASRKKVIEELIAAASWHRRQLCAFRVVKMLESERFNIMGTKLERHIIKDSATMPRERFRMFQAAREAILS
jgi:hypothetical protein